MVSPFTHPDSSVRRPLDGPELLRTNRYPELSELARRQRGVLSRAQLKAVGWSHNRIEHEVRVGRWTAVAPRVVAMQNGPLDREQLLWLGVLHAGPSSVLTHATACEAAGLQWTFEPTVHVLTSKSDDVLRLTGFRFHQTRRHYQDWIDREAEPRRLLIQHAVLLTAERDRRIRRAVGLLAATVQQRLSTTDELLLGCDQIRKLRHGALFRLALGDIAGGAQSFAEIDIGRICREAGLRPPDRQRIRADREGRRRYLDCEWTLADGRIVVLEVDGSFHMRTEHWSKDMQRERAVVVSGRAVLRCSSMEIRLEPDAIIADLVAIGVPPSFVRIRSA